jgi:3-methyladenine DNA glycosylase Tag
MIVTELSYRKMAFVGEVRVKEFFIARGALEAVGEGCTVGVCGG